MCPERTRWGSTLRGRSQHFVISDICRACFCPRGKPTLDSLARHDASCGGSVGVFDRRQYGCIAYHKRGTTVCRNALKLSLAALDDPILDALRVQLLRPAGDHGHHRQGARRRGDADRPGWRAQTNGGGPRQARCRDCQPLDGHRARRATDSPTRRLTDAHGATRRPPRRDGRTRCGRREPIDRAVIAREVHRCLRDWQAQLADPARLRSSSSPRRTRGSRPEREQPCTAALSDGCRATRSSSVSKTSRSMSDRSIEKR